MLEHLSLHNFKSAKDLSIRIAPLTVLSGLNGSGKSTVLQALALLKQSIESTFPNLQLTLRGPLVQLGRSEDVRFEDPDDDEIAFTLKTHLGEVHLVSPATAGVDTLPIKARGAVNAVHNIFKNFQFIQADRLTPATQYQQANTRDRSTGWLGCRGEYTVDFLQCNADLKVSPTRHCPRDNDCISEKLLNQVAPTDSLLDQTAGWLQQLSPGVRPRTVQLDLADATSLRFEYTGTSVDSGSRHHRPSNVGFGLTYCLPIIVACLAAPKDSLILLENPEAHLHPRGQAALGQLLARCASDGVQVVVETHSDHVLNGIRIAAKRRQISPDTVAVHFFERGIETGDSSVTSPILHANGRFSDWPEGFFDEWSKALDELLGE